MDVEEQCMNIKHLSLMQFRQLSDIVNSPVRPDTPCNFIAIVESVTALEPHTVGTNSGNPKPSCKRRVMLRDASDVQLRVRPCGGDVCLRWGGDTGGGWVVGWWVGG